MTRYSFSPRNALHEAILRNDLRGIQRALAAGADVNAPNQYGSAALEFAARVNAAPDVLRALIAAGADLHPQTTQGSPLMWALRWRNLRLVSLLLEAGADPNHNEKPNDSASMLNEALRWVSATSVLCLPFACGLRIHDEDGMAAHSAHSSPLLDAMQLLADEHRHSQEIEPDAATGQHMPESIIGVRRRIATERAETVATLLLYGLRLPSPDGSLHNIALQLARTCSHAGRPIILREAWRRRRPAAFARARMAR